MKMGSAFDSSSIIPNTSVEVQLNTPHHKLYTNNNYLRFRSSPSS